MLLASALNVLLLTLLFQAQKRNNDGHKTDKKPPKRLYLEPVFVLSILGYRRGRVGGLNTQYYFPCSLWLCRLWNMKMWKEHYERSMPISVFGCKDQHRRYPRKRRPNELTLIFDGKVSTATQTLICMR